MDIGDVIIMPIGGRDRTCIIVDKKTYGEIRRDFVGEEKFFDDVIPPMSPEPGIYVATYSRQLIKINDDYDKVMCYELMVGDEKAWMRDYLIVKYVVVKD